MVPEILLKIGNRKIDYAHSLDENAYVDTTSLSPSIPSYS